MDPAKKLSEDVVLEENEEDLINGDKRGSAAKDQQGKDHIRHDNQEVRRHE